MKVDVLKLFEEDAAKWTFSHRVTFEEQQDLKRAYFEGYNRALENVIKAIKGEIDT